MNIIVEKYGGSSVADTQKLMAIANSISYKIDQGNKIIVVLSAMGKTTDSLIAKAKEISSKPDPRELDMLLATGEQTTVALFTIALKEIGINAISLNAFQAGIKTDNNHNSAIIESINKEKILSAFEIYDVIAITGFQGVTESYDLSTLGRGGSDTTAVAIAAALGINCNIYSDVSGIFSADPGLYPNAKKLDFIGYDEMLEMASLGAKVLHSRSVEIAKKFKIKIYCAKTLSSLEGTYVINDNEIIEAPLVTGTGVVDNQTQATITNLPLDFHFITELFKEIAKHKMNVDMISTIINSDKINICFTITDDKLKELEDIVRTFLKDLTDVELNFDSDNVKLSVVGVGMKNGVGTAYRFFRALENIPIKLVTTSEIKISCLIPKDYKEKAAESIIKEFEL